MILSLHQVRKSVPWFARGPAIVSMRARQHTKLDLDARPPNLCVLGRGKKDLQSPPVDLLDYRYVADFRFAFFIRRVLEGIAAIGGAENRAAGVDDAAYVMRFETHDAVFVQQPFKAALYAINFPTAIEGADDDGTNDCV